MRGSARTPGGLDSFCWAFSSRRFCAYSLFRFGTRRHSHPQAGISGLIPPWKLFYRFDWLAILAILFRSHGAVCECQAEVGLDLDLGGLAILAIEILSRIRFFMSIS